MKKTLLTLGSAMLLQFSVQAQFNGAYTPANWSLGIYDGSPSAVTGGAPASIQLKGPGDPTFGISDMDYYINVPVGQSGTVGFDWTANDPTGDGENYFIINGTWYTLTSFTAGISSGTISLPVSGGDQIRFYTSYQNSVPANVMTLTLSNFSAPGNSPLPIKLKSFSGIASSNGNRLDWETASESEVSTFSIERSLDGKAYNAIGTVNAKNTASKYTFTDPRFDGTAYYRLRVNNIGGTPDYSNVISLHNTSSELNMHAYPNPATDKVTVRTNTAGSDATVSLIDLAGRVLDVQSISNNTASFNLKAQPAGIYIVRFNDGAQVQTIRVVKQ